MLQQKSVFVNIVSILNDEVSVKDIKTVYSEISESKDISWQFKLGLLKDLVRFTDLKINYFEDFKKLSDARNALDNYFERIMSADIYADVLENRIREVYGTRDFVNIQAVDVYTKPPRKTSEAYKFLTGRFEKNNYGKIVFKGGNVYRIERRDEDYLMRLGILKVVDRGTAYVSKINGIKVKNVPKYCDDLLLINFFNAELKKEGNKTKNVLQYILRERKVFVIRDGLKIAIVYPAYRRDKIVGYIYLDSPLGSDIRTLSVESFNLAKEKGLVSTYWTFLTSPSGQRQVSMSFMKLDVENPEKAAAIMSEITSKITAGGSDIILGAYKNEEIPFEKATKLCSRLSLPMTGSTSFGTIDSIAYFVGDKNRCGIEYSDGQGIINSLVMSEEYESRHKVRLPLKFLVGNALQARFSLVKGLHTVEDPVSMKLTIKKVSETYNAEIVYIDPQTNYKQLGIDIQSGLYNNKIVVLGTRNLAEVKFFGDNSVFKGSFDFNFFPVNLQLMEIPGKFSGKVNTSIQGISGLMNVPGADVVFKEIVKEYSDNLFNEKSGVNSIVDIKDVVYPDTTLRAIDLDFVYRDNNLFAAYIKQKLSSIKNAINDFKFPVEGIYGKLVRDKGLDFEVPILKANEIYVGGQFYKNRIGDMIRYPKNCSGEHFVCKMISLNTIKRRIIKLVVSGTISEEVGTVIFRYYALLKEGLIAVQSSNPRLARLLGGADYDGDGVIIYTDRRLVRLALQVPSMAIDFGKPPASGLKVPINFWTKDYVYDAAIGNANEGVGILTNRNMAFISVSSILKKMPEADLQKIYKLIKSLKSEEAQTLFFGHKQYSRKYVNDSELIDAKEVENYIDAVIDAGIDNRENFYNILMDAQPVNSSIAGRTIDSTKNGELIKTALQCLGDVLKAGMIQPIDFHVEETVTGELKFNAKFIETGFVEREDRAFYVGNDIIAQLKNEMVKYTLTNVEALYERAKGLRENNKVQIYPAFDKKTIESCQYIAKINSGILFNDSDSYTQLKEYIVGFVRNLTRDLSYEERFDLVEMISSLKNGEKSRFYLGFGVEAIMTALGDKNYHLREKLYSFKAMDSLVDGEIIDLKKGANERFFIRPKIDGVFRAEKKGRRIYAAIDAKEYVLSHDKHEDKFVLSITPGKNENNNFKSSPINVAIKRLNEVMKTHKLYTVSNPKDGDWIIGVNYNTNETEKIMKLVLPKGDSLISRYIDKKEINIHYIEAYNTKMSQKKEFLAIFGEFVNK